jgi:hypothetical protein
MILIMSTSAAVLMLSKELVNEMVNPVQHVLSRPLTIRSRA